MTSAKCLIVLILLITLAWTSKADGDLDASKSCAAEGGYSYGIGQDATVNIPKELQLKKKRSFSTIGPGVNWALRELEHLLESTFLILVDHPEPLKKVRKLAGKAQMLGLHVVEFMDKCSDRADTMILISDAVLNQKSEELTKDFLDMSNQHAEEMKQEFGKERDGYKEVNEDLHENIGDLLIFYTYVDNKTTILKQDMKIEKKKERAAKQEHEEKKQAIDNQLKMVQSTLAMVIKQREIAVGNMAKDRFIEGLKWGSPAGGYAAIFCGLFGAAIDFFNGDKLKEEFEVIMRTSLELQRKEAELALERKFLEQLTPQHKHLVELAIQYANYGDVRSILNATDTLKTAQKASTLIDQYFSAIYTTLSSLISNSKSGRLFQKKHDDPKYVERFQTTLEHIKQDWVFLRNMCNPLARSSIPDIDRYKFLYADTDRMAASNRSERRQKMLQEIESEISFSE